MAQGIGGIRAGGRDRKNKKRGDSHNNGAVFRNILASNYVNLGEEGNNGPAGDAADDSMGNVCVGHGQQRGDSSPGG